MLVPPVDDLVFACLETIENLVDLLQQCFWIPIGEGIMGNTKVVGRQRVTADKDLEAESLVLLCQGDASVGWVLHQHPPDLTTASLDTHNPSLWLPWLDGQSSFDAVVLQIGIHASLSAGVASVVDCCVTEPPAVEQLVVLWRQYLLRAHPLPLGYVSWNLLH